MKAKKALRQLFDGGQKKSNERSLSGERVKKALAQKRVYRTASVLACIVAFATTYMMILPAITVEKTDMEKMAGFTLTGSEEPLQPGDLVVISEDADVDSEEDSEHIGVVVDAGESLVVLTETAGEEVQLGEFSPEDPEVALLDEEKAEQFPELEGEVRDVLAAAKEQELLEDEEISELEEKVEETLVSLPAEEEDPAEETVPNTEATPEDLAETEEPVTESPETDAAPDTETVQEEETLPEGSSKDTTEEVPLANATEPVIEAETEETVEEQEESLEDPAPVITEAATGALLDGVVFALSYTVDYEYDVNGKTYGFSMAGEDAISFKALAEALHLYEKPDPEAVDPESTEEEICAAVSVEELDEVSDSVALGVFMSNIQTVEFRDPRLLKVCRVEEDSNLWDLKLKYHFLQTSDIWKPEAEIRQYNEVEKTFSAGDWALVSVSPFDTEEALKVEMKNGDSFEIRVTDEQNAHMQEDGVHVQTMPNPQGTTIDLFDYWVDDSLHARESLDDVYARLAWPGFDKPGSDAQLAWDQPLRGTGGNNIGINARDNDTEHGHALKFSPAFSHTVYDGAINNWTQETNDGWTQNGTNWNDVTLGLNSYTMNADPRQGIVEGTLVDGYPKLTEQPNTLGTNGESLRYLFDPKVSHAGKASYAGADHLLYVDPDGYYTYDSRDYKADFNKTTKEFSLTEQTSSDGEIRGFWPFGQQQFWTGMHVNTQFSMPVDGQVLNPKGEYRDMQFEFSGDDDTWLYIDGVLVGDGGGIHNRTEIDINFASGKVIVRGDRDPGHQDRPSGQAAFYKEKWLDDLFKAAGKYNDKDWEDIGDGSGHKRFKAGTYHTFDMFYLERGGGESNLYIHYNLVSTDDFTAHKAYEGFMDDETMRRDQFQFEMIGLDGQYQSVWNEATQTATVTKLNDTKHAIMPKQGREIGAGTVADPKKYHMNEAWEDSQGNSLSGTVYQTGVMENGDIRFGGAEIDEIEMANCDAGHPSQYRYILRELVPDDAVNENGVSWGEATEEQKAAGGFVKDQILYDGRIYYMTATVMSWQQTGSDGNTYTAYGLRKAYYTDDTFSTLAPGVTFVDFRNRYKPDEGEVGFTKVDGTNQLLPGAEFTLYSNMACTNIAKDLDGVEQIEISDENGGVIFDHLAAPRIYYMKETNPPAGYEPNDTVYKVYVEDSKDRTKTSRIVALDDESERPVERIVNAKTGEISVLKEWLNPQGKPISGGDHTARVKIQRKHYEAGNGGAHTINFTIQIQNRSDLVYTYIANNIIGETVTIDWWDTNQPYNSISVTEESGQSKVYSVGNHWDNDNHKNRLMTITDVSSDINVVVTYEEQYSWLFQGDHGEWIKNVSVVGAGVSYELVPDEAFNNADSNDHFALLSSPNWSKTWTIGTGKDFPATDGQRPYLYYVIEVDDNGREIPIGEETDRGYVLLGYSDNNAEGITDQGVLVVYNQIDEPGVELPHTGGPGAEGFLALGGALALGAAGLLIRRKVRQIR